jgi:hypothetical protein
MLPAPHLTKTRAWKLPGAHRKALTGASMAQMFAADPQRFELFSVRHGGLLLDYSKSLVTAETMQLPVLASEGPVAAYDASTNGLINDYKAHREN